MRFQKRSKLLLQSIFFIMVGLLLATVLMVGLSTISSALAAPLFQANNPNPVPPVMNYQGILRDPEGKPMTGSFKMTFRIYNDVTAPPSAAVWSEVHEAVTVRDGNFNALLGDNTPLPAAHFNTADSFIGVQVEPYDEMVPRQRFAMVPYAAHADFAHRLLAPGGQGQDALFFDASGGLVARQALTITYNNQSLAFDTNGINSSSAFAINGTSKQRVGIGTDNPQAPLHINGNRARLQNGNAYLDLDADGAAVAVNAPNSTMYVTAKNDVQMNSGFFGGNGNILLNYSTAGNVGIGLSNPQTKLDVNGPANVRGALTVNQVAPIAIIRYRNVGNDADFSVGLSAQEWNCTAAGWSATWQQKTSAGVNMVWTYVKEDGWWVRASFNSAVDDENPDVDVLCFRTEISSFEGDKTLNEPN